VRETLWSWEVERGIGSGEEEKTRGLRAGGRMALASWSS
jgi:hypothetical protein